MPTKAIAEQLASKGVNLTEVRRAIPPECLKPTPWRAWLTLARVSLLAAACLAILVVLPLDPGWALLWEIPALVVMWFVYGSVLVGYFLIGHDAEHHAFSRRGWVNRLVGTLCLSPLFNAPRVWKLTHDHHHRHTQLKGQDVDWAANLVTREEFGALTWRRDFAVKLGYALPFGIFFWIGRNTVRRAVAVRGMLGEERYAQERWGLLLSSALMLACSLSIYALIYWQWGLWPLLKLHAIPLAFSGIIGSILVTIGHASEQSLLYEEKSWSPTRAQVASSYNYRLPGWYEWLVLNINIHLPHHVCTTIPWYRLKQANAALHEAFPDYCQEMPLTWSEMAWIRTTPFLRHDVELGLYEIESDSGRAAA
ncbi:MAG: fatty acid desaturase [Planctomycetes bacterium]|nr:fatty acid desaturase [Planctomycetota bacterium]